MNRLNFGCGHCQPEGWLNIDREYYGQPAAARIDILQDWPLSFHGCFDIIHTAHVLHMFSWDELEQVVLPRLKGSLAPGGILRIVDFDPLLALMHYQTGQAEALIIPDDVEPTIDGKLCKYLTWYSTRKSICTAQFMVELLKRAGFAEARIARYLASEYDKTSVELDNRPNESWFVEAKT